jgi:hypothetical protein
MTTNDRLRRRFLSALGFGVVGCEAKEAVAPMTPPVIGAIS